jgi:hypothetical protein
VTPSPELSQSPTPTNTPTPSITPTITPSISITPSITPTITPSVTATITPSVSITPSITASVTPTITPTVTPTNSVTPTVTSTPTVTPSTSGCGPVIECFDQQVDFCYCYTVTNISQNTFNVEYLSCFDGFPPASTQLSPSNTTVNICTAFPITNLGTIGPWITVVQNCPCCGTGTGYC